MNAINQLLNTLENYGSITGTNIVKIQTLQKNYTIKDNCYLVQKKQNSNEYAFFANAKILPWWNYEYDNDQNLKIMKNNKEIIETIPKERYLSFKNEKDAITSSQIVIPLPLAKPLSVNELINDYASEHIIRTFITASVPLEIAEKITIKNTEAIKNNSENEQIWSFSQHINEAK
ncbi:hypothetical protein SKUN_00964 [Spiroplasma kunkelii CR2-3x]|uniref:Uncharacterized protein n=1 Tax=Spiroplasma kunkelii CR2-3x TaxID=273035 RepID=A0A0K2JI07_SPIKU|nr:hypothetical protein [Spiroplasma kunkelii]ALA97851.1 hypothetical protein SKUN_00964 [Spiroplasma kunkelii CR2-3x]